MHKITSIILTCFWLTYLGMAKAKAAGVPQQFSEDPSVKNSADNYTNPGSFGFQQSTSFYGSYGSGGQCGVQAYSDIGQNGNPQAETSWRVGVILNSKKCVDETELETIRATSNQHQSTVQQNIACISARTELIKLGHDPDQACVLK